MRTIRAAYLPLLATLLPALAGAAAPPAAEQIAAAVTPAPEAQRDAATVLGYGADGELTVLRRGEGELICLADDPTDERFHVACYHRSLEPFMERGRELRAEGLEREAVIAARRNEIDAGELAMPDGPTALYSLTGALDAWDPATGTLRAGNRVFVVYVPYATEASTGLPPEPIVDGAPWLMAPGEPWAHVMIVQGIGTDLRAGGM